MVAGSTVLVTGKKVYRKYYRSLNFSTTRTLSPRTVIGIGTTLS